MDEPCSALDPRSTQVIEQLIGELRKDLAIVIVTHNMQQARRVGDKVAFMYLGDLVEYGDAEQIFDAPRAQRTRDYVARGVRVTAVRARKGIVRSRAPRWCVRASPAASASRRRRRRAPRPRPRPPRR